MFFLEKNSTPTIVPPFPKEKFKKLSQIKVFIENEMDF